MKDRKEYEENLDFIVEEAAIDDLEEIEQENPTEVNKVPLVNKDKKGKKKTSVMSHCLLKAQGVFRITRETNNVN